MFFFFFFNDTATTEIYTLSLHDALPIYETPTLAVGLHLVLAQGRPAALPAEIPDLRSEEHTSELQSRLHLVCRLLLEKKNTVELPLNADVHVGRWAFGLIFHGAEVRWAV